MNLTCTCPCRAALSCFVNVKNRQVKAAVSGDLASSCNLHREERGEGKRCDQNKPGNHRSIEYGSMMKHEVCEFVN